MTLFRFARAAFLFVVSVAPLLVTGCGGDSNDGGRVLNVVGVYATSLDEPWNGVVNSSLVDAEANGDINYDAVDNVGYAPGAFEGTLRRLIAEKNPDMLIGDSFGNEAAARRVAADFPAIAFAFGSAEGPTAPNYSVFDNWIHEPAYLSGMLAGGMTKSNVVGIVGGFPVAEVNRLVNGFTAGARSVNPDVRVLVTYLSSWFDPAAAAAATREQIAQGADLFYAERAGVIETAAENGFLSVGNITDQESVSPSTVLTSCLWSTEPMVEYLISVVREGTYVGEDLRRLSMLTAGGAALAPLNYNVTGGIPAELADRVLQTQSAIARGGFVVPIDESTPAGSVIK